MRATARARRPRAAPRRARRPGRIATRHRQLLDYFGHEGVSQERQRYVRSIETRYQLELIQRFLERHFRRRPGSCLEVGPGTGRFSDLLSRRSRDLVLLDLSRPMLQASRRSLRGPGKGRAPSSFVQGSIEDLPFLPKSFDRVVALGVLPFVATDLGPVLKSLGGLLRPRGLLLFDVHTPSQDTMSIFPAAPRVAALLLREPSRYYLWSVIRRGYQPFDPKHLARFEVAWLRPHQLAEELHGAGLTVVDQMAIGPNFVHQPRLLRHLRRDPKAYATAIRLEEETGHWPELLGAGAGLLVAARPGR
jgi:SAM-dependent methyltransferase